MNPSFWQGGGQPTGRIYLGQILGENPNHPGTWQFRSSNGLLVRDAHILSPDIDPNDNGEITKPTPGSLAVAAFDSDGAQCFILGFHRPAKFDETSDTTPTVGNPDDNRSSADKVFRTSGGASFMLKRGGSIVIEGGPGTGVILNPLNSIMTLRASNFTQTVDGFRSARGRVEIGKTDPATVHVDEFLHQVGPSFDRVRITHGSVESDVRRRLELASVVVAGGNETAIVKTRETYKNDGTWIGEGPTYKWGGDSANEPGVLGNQLCDTLGQLIDAIAQMTVITAVGPSTPPDPPTQAKLNALKATLTSKILSTYIFLSKSAAVLT